MSRFANLADKAPPRISVPESDLCVPTNVVPHSTPPSRIGRKAISGYFSPEMSLAMHMCARRQGISLQDLMAEAFDDVLRKHGESPIGD